MIIYDLTYDLETELKEFNDFWHEIEKSIDLFRKDFKWDIDGSIKVFNSKAKFLELFIEIDLANNTFYATFLKFNKKYELLSETTISGIKKGDNNE